MDSEQAALSRLLVVLKRERDAIPRKDVEVIDTTLSEKLDILEQLQQLDQDRRQLLTDAGCENSRRAFEQWLQQFADPALLHRWSQLMAELKECHELHRVNIQLLESGRRQVQRVLSVITGSTQQPVETVYDQGGSTSRKLSTNTFAKA
ncbi:MAG: flagellar protein FlgN [Gammaproteobacteria bacterium]|nr:flagellar protein FlgN [Gammaproteobacteria bacterium]